MKQITEAGDYRVRIKGAYWTKLAEKNGDTNRLQAVLPGQVEIGGEVAEITAYMPFTNAIIQSGKNAGKKLVDLNNDLLIQLGMKPGANGYIDPAKLTEELEGKEALFVVDYENDQKGRPQLRVRFVNPVGRESLEPDMAAAIFQNLTGSANAAQRPAFQQQSQPKPAFQPPPIVPTNPDDPIPF